MKEVRIVVQVDDDRQVDQLTWWMDRVTDDIGAHAWGYHVHDENHPHNVAAWRVVDSATELPLSDPDTYENTLAVYEGLTGETAETAYLEPLYVQ